MKLPKEVIEDIEKEIDEIRQKCCELDKTKKTMLPNNVNGFELEFDKFVDYLYFRLKQLIKYRENDRKNH